MFAAGNRAHPIEDSLPDVVGDELHRAIDVQKVASLSVPAPEVDLITVVGGIAVLIFEAAVGAVRSRITRVDPGEIASFLGPQKAVPDAAAHTEGECVSVVVSSSGEPPPAQL